MVDLEKIKALREETGISIGECKKALEEAGNDLSKAKEILRQRFGNLAKKLEKRETKEGIIEAYLHPGKRVGVLIKLRCESDFVAKSPEFQKLAHELCLQIAAVDPREMPILEQPWIRDETKQIKDLIQEYIAKFGENIILEDYCRFQI